MEDIFEELADTGDDLERVVEGGEPTYSDVEDDNAPPKEDEAEEEKKRIVKPRKAVLNPQPKLDPVRLCGKRGIGTLESFFSGIEFKGKGHEKSDLNLVMTRLEHWAHRLFPKMTFDDCIDKIEDLGAKRQVLTYKTKIRMGLEGEEDTVNRGPSSPEPVIQEDPFDALFNTIQPPAPPQQPTLTDEQRARMLRNRLLAEERRMARMKAAKDKAEAEAASLDQEQNGGDPIAENPEVTV